MEDFSVRQVSSFRKSILKRSREERDLVMKSKERTILSVNYISVKEVSFSLRAKDHRSKRKK